MRNSFLIGLARSLGGLCITLPVLALIWWGMGSPSLTRIVEAAAVGLTAAAQYLGNSE